ncbi:MAG TPA: hypothetical protein VK660_07100 [Xanthomonadaceae bacterium]|jgi:hypothetical protein|nr:hypothetical protein [Xanthomonadaceae bacterium]
MRKLIPGLLVVGVVAIAGCNKEGPGGTSTSGPGVVAADDPLNYVPSDTPYVMANIDPQPVDVSNFWIDKVDKSGKVGDMYATQLDGLSKMLSEKSASCPPAGAGSGGSGGAAMQDSASGQGASSDAASSPAGDAAATPASAAASTESAGADGSDKPADATTGGPADTDNCSPANVAHRDKALKLINAVKTEVAGKDVKGLMDLTGVNMQAHAAFYGIGLVPVLRVELAKPDNLRATIGRIETTSGSKLATGKVGNLDYWVVHGGAADPKLEGVFAISGKQLVATIAPAKASDADLRTLFGLDKPAKSLAASGDLAALDKKMNYLSYTSGYIDSARIVAALKSPPTPLETSFLTAIGQTKPSVDAVCAAEYDSIATAWPRASFGITDLSVKHMALRGVLETRADIAKDLMTLRAPMPGMKLAQDSLVDFGFSANLTKLPDLATKYADATAKTPWKCPQLASLNQSAEQSKTTLTNPAFAGYAPMFNGFHAIVDKLVMTEGNPVPDIAAVIVIGSANPTQLLAMAGQAVPTIASAGLKPDGVAKPLPPIPNMPITAPLFGAMTDKLLAVSIGAGEDAKIPDAMKLDDAQQPLFAAGAKGEIYHLIAQTERKSEASMTDPTMKQSIEQSAKMMDMEAGWFKRVDMSVELTDQGIELKESVDTQQP